jgi:Mrp family chromosome partitioning ATPase
MADLVMRLRETLPWRERHGEYGEARASERRWRRSDRPSRRERQQSSTLLVATPRQLVPRVEVRRSPVVITGRVVEVPYGPLPLPLLHDADSPAAASYRALRLRLQGEGDPRIIAVTSPGPAEGKTTTAANLALAIAEQADDRVLLVEADRHAPRLAEAFGTSVPVSFEAQLASCLDVEWSEWWAVAVGFDHLHLLANDPTDTTGIPMAPPAYRRLLESAHMVGYEYVVFDCPSIATAGDLSLLSGLVDGVILSAMARTTRRRDLVSAAEHLAPAKVVATVLNGAAD